MKSESVLSGSGGKGLLAVTSLRQVGMALPDRAWPKSCVD